MSIYQTVMCEGDVFIASIAKETVQASAANSLHAMKIGCFCKWPKGARPKRCCPVERPTMAYRRPLALWTLPNDKEKLEAGPDFVAHFFFSACLETLICARDALSSTWQIYFGDLEVQSGFCLLYLSYKRQTAASCYAACTHDVTLFEGNSLVGAILLRRDITVSTVTPLSAACFHCLYHNSWWNISLRL